MATIRVLLAAALLLATSTAAVHAEEPPAAPAEETNLALLLDAVRSNRRALVTVNLGLSDEEAARFWPVYDKYQHDLDAVGDRLAKIIQQYSASYREISNEAALKLVQDYLAVEADRVQVRRTYLPQFAKVLPGRTVARLYQIENKLEAVTRYELAAAIPVVDEPGAAAKK